MPIITEEMVIARLSRVKGPDLKGDIVSLGLVNGILVQEGRVIFSVNVPAERAQELEPLRAAAEKAVMMIDGVSKVTAVLTAERKAGSPSIQSAPVRPAPSAAQAASIPPPMQAQAARAQAAGAQADRPNQKAGVPGIKSIVAVASGKGGVGKSTTSVNLALALQSLGKKVGILDADIYGPSMPRLLGISDRPSANGRVLSPLESYGLKVMSMGFLVDEETPMIWRGPMVISALTQMLREVAWGELDLLIVDMPPGTGDAQLTMAQQVPLAGAVIVSTPQDIALIDARKGLNMFRKVDVPILGIIENMSTFICPKCGERSDIFGHGGARDEAGRMGVPFLGEIPLHMDIRSHSDGGTPVTISMPDGPHAAIYKEIAAAVINRVDVESASVGVAAPSIVFE
ncbi:MAG: iron-sulfur cluster carrier protein ApbC [Rhizobiaceae bacterium]|nr:iron-sulfur cluster carrier protein ApbC [Rhizobiaceae bacterium]